MNPADPPTQKTGALARLTAATPAAPLLFDGAMGTMLHQRGVAFEDSFDRLNLENPALVAEVHRAYLDAGAEALLTNTFSANRFRLARHGLGERVAEINRAGVALARRVVLASFREVLIAGDVGPLGVRLAPFGRVQPEQARAAFAEQIEVLAGAGIDLIALETFSDLAEILQALRAARQVCRLPVIALMTFTRDDRTPLGNSPREVAQALHGAGAEAIGINCSGGPSQILRILEEMRRAEPQARYMVKPNAGLPEQVGGRIMYPAGPAYFGEYAQDFRQAGAALVGGCCGTTPAHIAAMRATLDLPFSPAEPKGSPPAKPGEAAGRSATHQATPLAKKLGRGEFIATVEMAPPRGTHIERTLAAAGMLQEAGADCVNIADSPMARMRMSPWAVASLVQERLQLETVLHFPTRGRSLLRVQGDLLAAHALDVRNIFIIMGDPTSIGDYPDAMDDYDIVPSGLLKIVTEHFNTGSDYAGADIGQPTSFFAGCALDMAPRDLQREARVLQRKIRNGAGFALTQPVFEPERADEFVAHYRQRYGDLHLPLIAGVLPLYNERHAAFLQNELPGVDIPPEYVERMSSASDQRREGIRIALELIDQIRPWAAGVYLMPPFSRYDIAAEIIEGISGI